MNGSILDTNIIIDFFRKKHEVVKAIFELENIFVPVTAVGELYYGAYLSKKSQTHIEKIEGFLSKVNILLMDEEILRLYGKIKSILKEKGKPISENDIWIASITIQHELELLSNDSHFENIENIKIKKIII